MPDQRGYNGKPLRLPSQPPHEYGPGIRPKDATDKEARTPAIPWAFRRRVVQRNAYAFILGEGCAVLACHRTGRADSLPPNSRRAAPPICPDLIFDRHNMREGHDE